MNSRAPAGVIDDIRRLGFLSWLMYATNAVLSRLSGHRVNFMALWFYAQPVALIPTIPFRDDDRIRTRVLRPGELPESIFPRPPGVVEERFDEGSTCIVAMQDVDLAGFIWLHFTGLRERLVRCDFEPLPPSETAWDFDLYVSPRFRLGRTYGRLWGHAKRILEERGVTTTISWITFDNVASQRAHARMGARRIGWALIIALWSIEIVIASTRPYFNITTGIRRTRIFVDAS